MTYQERFLGILLVLTNALLYSLSLSLSLIENVKTCWSKLSPTNKETDDLYTRQRACWSLLSYQQPTTALDRGEIE